MPHERTRYNFPLPLCPFLMATDGEDGQAKDGCHVLSRERERERERNILLPCKASKILGLFAIAV